MQVSPCIRECVYVYVVYLHCLLLTIYDRRIRFYNIMQLACIFKYILEFGTLVETTHRSPRTSYFRPSFPRPARSSANPLPPFPAGATRTSPFSVRHSRRRICFFRPPRSTKIVYRMLLIVVGERDAIFRAEEETLLLNSHQNWRSHP